MALGTSITAVSLAGEGSAHQVFAQQITLAADSAYTTGGTVKATSHLRRYLASYDTRAIVAVEGWGVLASVLYLFKYDAVNDKLLAFLASTGAEVANATDLSAMTMKLTVWSK